MARMKWFGMFSALVLTCAALSWGDTRPQADSNTHPFYVKMLFENVPLEPPININSGDGKTIGLDGQSA